MSVENFQQKLLSRQLNNKPPTPYQIQRQIEENNLKQTAISKIKESLGIENIHPSLSELINKDPNFIANFRAGIENIKKCPDGEALIPLIELNDIRKDGTIRISRLKKKI